MSRRRKWSIAGGVGFLALCLGLSFLFRPAALDEGVDLKNGWRVRFLDAGLGKVKYNSDSSAKQFVRTYAPRAIEMRMDRPITIDRQQGPGNTDLLMLFHVWSPEGKGRDRNEDPFRPSLELIESSGFVFRHPYSGMNSHFFGKAGIGIITDERTFPRRDPLLHFRLRNGNSPEVLIDRSIPNPGYQSSFPEWTPQPLPITQTVAPVSLTLTGITVHSEKQYMQAHFTTTATDPQWETPHVHEEFSDATGNHGVWLSPHEPAWKVKAKVRRRLDATFLPAEVWTLATLATPQPKSVAPFREVRTINGILVKPQRLFGPGKYRIENGVVVSAGEKPPGPTPESTHSIGSSSGSTGTIHYTDINTDFPAILIEYAELPPLTHLEVRIRDQTGRDLRKGVYREGRGSMNGQPYGWYPFQPQPESTSIVIEVVVHKSLEFEFLVKPPVPEASAP